MNSLRRVAAFRQKITPFSSQPAPLHLDHTGAATPQPSPGLAPRLLPSLLRTPGGCCPQDSEQEGATWATSRVYRGPGWVLPPPLPWCTEDGRILAPVLCLSCCVIRASPCPAQASVSPSNVELVRVRDGKMTVCNFVQPTRGFSNIIIG